MHEYGITNEVVHQVLHACEDSKILKPKKIEVEIGELTTYKKDSILFYFESIRKENPLLSNARLEVEMIKGKIRCDECKKESNVEPLPIILCPNCSSLNIEIIEGNEIRITEII